MDTTPNSEIRKFSVHESMLPRLIFEQHHSKRSALVELVQNSLDADARKISISLSRDGFTHADDGKGFRSEEVISQLFEVFGKADQDVVDTKFSRFRIGRGQIMGLAKTVWRSNAYSMDVDVKTRGMEYLFCSDLSPVDGCLIEGAWYEPLNGEDDHHFFRESVDLIVKDLSRTFQYVVGAEIQINGQIINVNDHKWDFECDDFLMQYGGKLGSIGNEVSFYNLGIYTDTLKGFGFSAKVITKKHLGLNLTRSKIRTDCPIFGSICRQLRGLKPKFNPNKKYSEQECWEILDGLFSGVHTYEDVSEIPIMKDLQGRRRYSFRDLVSQPYTIVPGSNIHSIEADRLDQMGTLLVLNGSVFRSREITNNAGKKISSVIFEPNGWRSESDYCIDLLLSNYHAFERCVDVVQNDNIILAKSELSVKEILFVDVLNKLRRHYRFPRFVVGVSAVANAWTDGKSFIAINRKSAPLIEHGIESVLELAHLILHEYVHVMVKDMQHTGQFYKKYHDLCMNRAFVQDLMKRILIGYDDALAKTKRRPSSQHVRAMRYYRRDGLSKASKCDEVDESGRKVIKCSVPQSFVLSF